MVLTAAFVLTGLQNKGGILSCFRFLFYLFARRKRGCGNDGSGSRLLRVI